MAMTAPVAPATALPHGGSGGGIAAGAIVYACGKGIKRGRELLKLQELVTTHPTGAAYRVRKMAAAR